MSSLITKQTQESIQRFEQQAGLRDAGYTPHKGLTTEETKYLRVAEALHGLTTEETKYLRVAEALHESGLAWCPAAALTRQMLLERSAVSL
ncbi:hypothetical protein Celaphus_00006669 [Cervus elaphus hippelaphus]|uniref:Putative monooxygenase p33MONOX n=1 Tax=Cervus elaphus hippelaphus TaxID=46360 RepID=A0A212CV13_CEREH|nr:hypothetical protein Celaphus_00006669 [Cervus elaphus hippelaphus]